MKRNSLILFLFLLAALAEVNCFGQKQGYILTKTELQDKIKGGWAGQLIGCTFGGPTEFKFKGVMIPDDQPIPWGNQWCTWWFDNIPGLYDDVAVDLTFVEVIEKEGIQAKTSSFANSFAHGNFHIAHANQQARYNILKGILPPKSGYWVNNPHSDDLDFQIESDFIGLMSPGMVNAATDYCDSIGHIMCYGDGWYGGVYVASMYSLAFVSGDLEHVVTEALKTIPENSNFHQCISDVIGLWKKNPNDWKETWRLCSEKWSYDKGCPMCVFDPGSIDAKLNAAYIVIGLLYGHGDYGLTMEICTRCGQDSDCNPANAGGILGTFLGYSHIPEYWKSPVYPVENRKFVCTTLSLNDVYAIGMKHALENLKLHGADFEGENIRIPKLAIKPVRFEEGFAGIYPKERYPVKQEINEKKPELIFQFEGIGFLLDGEAWRDFTGDYNFQVEMYIDGKLDDRFSMSTDETIRRYGFAWKYNLPDGKHEVRLKVLNPVSNFNIKTYDIITYSSKRTTNALKSN